MNRLLLFHREHILFTQNHSEIPCSVKLAPSSRLRRHDPQISLLSIPFIIFSFLAKPSPIPPTLRPLPHHTHDPPCADMGSSSKDHRAKPDEGRERGRGRQKPKILLSSPNWAKNLKPSHQLDTPLEPPTAQLYVEEAVSTLAETSAQGNSNEEETVRERHREDGGGGHNSDKIGEKNEMGERSVVGRRSGGVRRGC